MTKIGFALALLIVLWQRGSVIEKVSSNNEEEFRGVLLNEQCKNRQPEWLVYASEHDLSCAMLPQCFLSGYVLVIDGDTAVKLDRRGELLARRLLLTTKKHNDFRVVVRGRLSDSVLSVHSLDEQR
jgi:hypothetical protein